METQAEVIRELNKICAEMVGETGSKAKGTRTYYIKGKIENKATCYTRQRARHNGRRGFWSWIQTEYKNGRIKRTKFAKSGSKMKAEARAERLFKQLELKGGETK
jgi:hypothetical protein